MEQPKRVTLAEGFHPNCPEAVYRSLEAANFSTLKHFEKSAAHVYAYMTQPPEGTEPQKLGTAAHCAVLSPDLFQDQYFQGPEGDKRLKGVKLAWAEAEEEHPDAIGLRPRDYRMCLGIRDAVWTRHAYAQKLLSGEGFNEATGVWTDPTTGLLCKLRSDRITQAPDGWGVLVDIKTIVEANDRKIQYAIRDFAYHLQGAHYLEGMKTISPADRKWILIFIEKSPPYAVRVVEVDFATMELGLRVRRKYLDEYARCLDSGIWPAYPGGIDVLGVPQWEFDKEAQELDGEL